MTTLFWISFSLLFFCYIGYGLLLFFFNRVGKLLRSPKKVLLPDETVPVTLIVAAYNEQAILEQKIKNTLAIDYPSGELQVIIVTDGSTDESAAIVRKYPSITLIDGLERKGKSAAIKRAMQRVTTPFVVFSDANAMLNELCIRKMMRHYTDPRIGGIAGEKKIINEDHPSAVGAAEGLYWQYESFMKRQDAQFNTVVGAAGELFSIRTGLFRELPDNLVLDDFVTSMLICLQGYKIAYEREAFATELPSASLAEEQKRKERIAAGAYQSIGYLKSCLNIFKYPLLSFQYTSRRLLRWVCCPLLLLIMVISNIWIVATGTYPAFYNWFLITQCLLYTMAFAGWVLVRAGKSPGILTIPFYFVFMNYCLVKGFFRFTRGKHTVLWEKSRRQVMD
jgi:cellulose synthase/poly-beta-1,6-N-acetylglucosamine synthase-like glycosyltransferase